MNRSFTFCLLVFLMLSAVAFAQDNPAPAPASAATQPAATEWTLPQQDDIYLLLPAGENIYYLCADHNKEPAGARKRYSTYMCFNTRTSGTTNVLLSIPGRFDPDKLMVFGFSLSPDRKFALMNVNSLSGSNLGGLYMVDLVKNKARKFPPTGGTWLGDELVVNVKDSKSRYTQLMRYSITGAKLGPLPICGQLRAADEQGKNLYVMADPKDLRKPLPEKDIASVAKPLMVDKDGKVTSEIAARPGGNMSVTSPNLKFCAADAAQNGNAAVRVFSLDGKKEWFLPEMMKTIYVGDEGDVLSISYAPVNGGNGSTLEYWDASGKKVWTGPQVSAAAFYDGKAYYVETVDSKVMIKTKTLVEKK